MRNKYFLSLLIIPVAILLLPLGLGFTAKGFVDNQLETMPISKGITIKVSNFKRGWFSSTADMVVEFKNPSLFFIANTQPGLGQPAPLALTSKVQIKHGPFMLDNSDPAHKGMRFGRLLLIAPLAMTADNPQTAELAKIIENQPLINVWGKQTFLGAVNLHIKTPLINYKDPQGIIQWDGINSEIEVSSNNNHVKADVTFAPIELKLNNAGYLKTGEMKINTNSKRNEHGLWFGKSTLNVADFDALSAQRNHLIFNALKIEANTNNKKDAIEAQVKTDINKFSINDANYGPMHLEYTLANLDENAVASLHDFAKNLPDDVSFFATLDQGVVKDQIDKLLARRPEMKVENFQIQSDKGSFSLNAKFGMDENASKNIEQFSQNWTNQVDAEVNMKAAPGVSRKIVSFAYLGSLGNIAQFIALAPNADKNAIDAMIDKEAQKILDRLTEQKYLVLNDSQYNLNFTFKKGTALVNGQSVPNFMKHPGATAPEANVAPNPAMAVPGTTPTQTPTQEKGSKP